MMKGMSGNLQLHLEMVEVLHLNRFSSSGLPWIVDACSYSPEISFFCLIIHKACPWTMSCGSPVQVSFFLSLLHGTFRALFHVPPISVTLLNLQMITQVVHAQACRRIKTFQIILQC